MNITMNELLLKKVKFGAEPASNEPEAQAPAESNPEKGMNALTFMGIKNLMSNPKLAQEVGVPTEEPEAKADENSTKAKSYVAPYSSNIAFQGGKSKLAGNAIKLGTAALLAQGVLSSCIKQDVDVEIDMTAMYELAAKFQQYMDQQDAFTKMFMEKFMQLLADVEEMKKDGKTQMEADQHFYNEMLKYMLMSTQNQEYIKLLLQKNGKTEEDAKKILEQILAEFNNIGNDSEKAKALLDKILAMLGMINNNLVSLLNKVDQIGKEISDMQKQLEILHNDNKQSQEIMLKLNLKMAEYGNYLKEISAKISSVNGSIDDLAEQMGVSKLELFSLLQNIGVSIIDAQNMSAKEIADAIKSVEAAVKALSTQVQILGSKVDKGFLSAEEYHKLIAQMLSCLNKNAISILNELKNKYSNDAAMLALLDKIYNRMGDLLNGQEAQLEEAGRQTIILNAVYELLQKGLPADKLDIIINLLAQGNVNTEKLMQMVCALNQNVTEGRAENRQFANDLLAKIEKLINQGDIHTNQLDQLLEKCDIIISLINSVAESSGKEAEALRKLLLQFMDMYKNGNNAVLDAIANIKLDDSGCNFDPETLKPLLNQLNAIYQQLLSMGKDVSDIKLGINLVASLVEPLGADVSAIYNLLVTNMPKFFEKADEIIDAINKHKCCECDCNGNNHNEGLIDDITSLLNC